MADIKQYEKEINIIDPHAHVSVINDADLEGPPRQMQYINAYKASEGISIPDDPLIGCECESCDIKHEKSCCGGSGNVVDQRSTSSSWKKVLNIYYE